jgi:hypothetical protein
MRHSLDTSSSVIKLVAYTSPRSKVHVLGLNFFVDAYQRQMIQTNFFSKIMRITTKVLCIHCIDKMNNFDSLDLYFFIQFFTKIVDKVTKICIGNWRQVEF